MRDNAMVYGLGKTDRDDDYGSCSIWQRGMCPAYPSKIHAGIGGQFSDGKENGDTATGEDPGESLVANPTANRFDDEERFARFRCLDGGHIYSLPNHGKHQNMAAPVYNKCDHSCYFEMGSLGFFRSPQYTAYFDSFEETGGSCRPTTDNPLHLSCPRPLLKDSGAWTLLQGWQSNTHTASRQFQQSTPATDVHVEIGSTQSSQSASIGLSQDQLLVLLGDPAKEMTARHKLWQSIADDISRQHRVPALMSGNTAIDDRNFALIFRPEQQRAVLDTRTIIQEGRV
jgi:hypothetical protein